MTKKRTFPKLKAEDIARALGRHYGNEAVVAFEVPDATGFQGKGRRMDAVAVGCWPSRGMYLHAIEIKVSRADFLKEIRDPGKAEAIAQYCDSMFVAVPKGMVDAEELPKKWGLFEVSGSGSVRLAAKPGKLKIKKIDRAFNAALVRAVVEQQSEEVKLAKRVDKARSDAWADAKEHYESTNETLTEKNRELNAELSKWRSFGHSYRKLKPEQVGRLLKSLSSLRGDYGALNSLRVSAQAIQKEADAIEEVAKLLFDPDEAADA